MAQGRQPLWLVLFHAALLCFAVLLSGCATVDPTPDFARTTELIEQSTGLAALWDRPALEREEIERLLSDGLTVEDAMRLALLNSRRLHAQFQRIGIARADLVQSGLLRNPSLSFAALFPTSGGRAQIEGSLIQAISDLWQIPLRKEAAGHVLDEAILQTARAAGELVADVRIAHHRAVAADEFVDVAEDNWRLRQRAADLVTRRLNAGEASRVDLMLARSRVGRSEVDLAQARLEAANAKRDLARLLSLDVPHDRIVLLDAPSRLLMEVEDVEHFVSQAVEHRLDLRAARSAALAAESAMALAKRGALPGVGLGVGVERLEISGPTLIGPAVAVTVPIFDQNQAQVARSLYAHTEAILLYEALVIEASSDIRQAAHAVQVANANVAIYAERIRLETQQAADLAMQAYEAGETDLLVLLESQELLLSAQRESIAATLAAWIALAELERTVGASP